ncbi:unnamed protein product, partial [Iphiclides podalirius]
MRVRKKPDLRIKIPSYPHDYVEMPVETKRLILEANRSANDLQYIDGDDAQTSAVGFVVGSPLSDKETAEIRSSTPEVKFVEPFDGRDGDANNSNGEKTIGGDSPVVYRSQLKGASISPPEVMQTDVGDALGKKEGSNVSSVDCLLQNSFLI